MTVEELRRLYRSRFLDLNARKYALGDDDFLMYLNEAQDEACARADLIFDKTSSFCTIAVTAGKSIYPIEESIYAFKYVRVVSAAGVSTRLTATTDEELDYSHPDWRDLAADTPSVYLYQSNTIELITTPDAAYTLRLEAHRLGERLTGDKQVPEIPAIWHADLVNWVMYRMYSMPDEDLSNPRKAAEHYAEFERKFGPPPTAAHHQDKYRDRPHRNKAMPI